MHGVFILPCTYHTLMYLPTSLQELQTSSAYMKIGDFPDEPIPPEVFNPSKKPKSEDISHILGRTGRKVKKMLPDGNCLFRSLSFCLYHSQDMHLEIKTLVDFIRTHSDRYKHFLMEHTLSEHLESMKKPFVWGTQVELQAAADYYEMCIYLFTKKEQQERYHWHRYTPRNSAVATDNLPHIELAHPRSVHFDPILDAATLQIPKSFPQLDGATEYFEGIL